MTSHDAFHDRLSDYVDGELPDAEQRAVAAHLAECTSCRQAVEELEAVVRTARALAPAEPRSDLWAGIAARIEPRGSAAAPTSRRLSFSVPQLAAASVVIALLSGWAAMRLVAPRLPFGSTPTVSDDGAPLPGSAIDTASATANPEDRVVRASMDDAEYDAAVADLKTALEKGRDTLDPATVLIIEDNLNTINRAVDEARRALAEDPANGYLTGYLIDTRRRQLDLLRQAAVLANRAD